jgi:uncharacterized delta-60 repeat protein
MANKVPYIVKTIFILAIFLLSVPLMAYGQILDTSFRPVVGRKGTAFTVRRADGKLVLAGSFQMVGGVRRSLIAVINPDNTVDTSFNAGVITYNLPTVTPVIGMVSPQADGKIIIGGDFTHFNGVPRKQIARLNTDGSLDPTFDIGQGVNGAPKTIKVLPDGKILVGGSFTTFNGQSTPPLVRLNSDGTLDQSFFAIINGIFGVDEFVVQTDGKIVAIGQIYSIPAGDPRGIVRLNVNGSIDNTFDLGGAPDGLLDRVALQADGKVLVSGAFNKIAGVGRSCIARLNTNGTVDTGFIGGVNVTAFPPIHGFSFYADGRIIITGNFDRVNGISQDKIARLNADGSLDTSLSLLLDADDSNASIAPPLILEDQRLLVNGNFSVVNEIVRYGFARLNTDGTPDPAFTLNIGITPNVSAIIYQGNGKYLVAGSFNHTDGTMSNGVVRLNSDGTIDPGFNTGTGLLYTLFPQFHNGFGGALALQSDGKILLGGDFTSFNNVFRPHLVRLNADGTLDPAWPGLGALIDGVTDIVVQPDGKILVANAQSPGVVRLNPNGTADPGFNVGTGSSSARKLILQPDGKILVSGTFTSFNGTPRNRIARLSANGSMDTDFNTSNGPNNFVASMALQPDGKVLIGGTFTSIGGTGRMRVARLNTDGSLDTGFDPGTGADAAVNKILLRSNGKILVGGSFNNFNGASRKKLVQLSSNGSLDPVFGSNLDWYALGSSGANVQSLIESGQSVFAVGTFARINNQDYASVARLRVGSSPFDFDGDGKADVSVFRPSEGNWYVQNSGDGSVTGLHFGQTNDLIAPGDFDGDGKVDISVFRPSEGNWYRLNSSDGSFFGTHFGIAEDKPAVGDFDGDGKADIAVFRPSEGNWYRLNSSDGSFFGTHFGATEDKPAVGDFDGDGKTDISLFRPSEGNWYRLNSSDGSFFGTHFGIAEDRPTPADYDGDGKTDISVFRPSAGDWFRLNSNDGTFFGTHFGVSEDKPAAADFDGDGKADIAVFRPSEGNWYILNSTTGFLSQHFGATEDTPTPNSFVY